MNDSGVEIFLLDDAGHAAISVDRAWLPMAIWDGVRLRVTESRGLTLMERFAIECLLELGTCNADDLTEFASIPVQLGSWLLSSLAQQRLAVSRDAKAFEPVTNACVDALSRGNIATEREERQTLLWFPETEEFAVLRDGDKILREFKSLTPQGTYPLPERLRRRQRGDLLRDAFSARRIYGIGKNSIAEGVDGAAVGDAVPVYYSSARFPSEPSVEWQLEIAARQRPEPRADGTIPSAEQWPLVKRVLGVPVLDWLVGQWRSQLQLAREGINGRLLEKGFTNVSWEGAIPQAVLGEAATRRIAQDRLLTQRISVAIAVDREIEYNVPMELLFADAKARAIFDLACAVRRLLASSDTAGNIDAICAELGVSRVNVVDRLWQLKMFGKVYQLREAEDFAG
jgi:hypothetical protein